MKINTALILCAGLGKRLNPITLKKPKPLLEIKQVTMLENCINIIQNLGIRNIIINTLAYTSVDEAENDRENAFSLNTLFPTILARWCYNNSCLLVHYSSDYVFSGKGINARTEDSETDPINYYGLTKLKGDIAIKNSKANSIILRCSWIYSLSHNSFEGYRVKGLCEKIGQAS